MQRLEVSCAVRPIYGSLGSKGLNTSGFGGLVVSMLASGTQDHGFEPS
jgi:hypothetical protein